jgi:hypothetical protein
MFIAAQDHPRYAEWKAAFERFVTAQDRLLAASASEAADAETEQAEALAAYDKIRFDIVARGGRAFGRKGGST